MEIISKNMLLLDRLEPFTQHCTTAGISERGDEEGETPYKSAVMMGSIELRMETGLFTMVVEGIFVWQGRYLLTYGVGGGIFDSPT